MLEASAPALLAPSPAPLLWTDFCEAAAVTTRLAVDGCIFTVNPECPFVQQVFIQNNICVSFCQEGEPAPGVGADWA